MKMNPVDVIEVEGEGFMGLLGKIITIFCANYIYTGRLVGVNESCVKLSNAKVVFETGAFSDENWKIAEPLPNDLYVQMGLIESFTILKG